MAQNQLVKEGNAQARNPDEALECLVCSTSPEGDSAKLNSVLGKPGDDLLSRALRHSTIGAGAFHGRVRDGIGCSRSAKITRPAKGGVKSGLHASAHRDGR